MKKFFTLLALALLTVAYAKAQNVTIPDANFKSVLVGNALINTNGDGEIQLSEAQAFTGYLNVDNKNIADLTGIAAFGSLQGLTCNNNQLTALEIFANIALVYLDCSHNQLTGLNVFNNDQLQTLNVGYNQISTIDVTTNTQLTQLYVYRNQLTSINITHNLLLKRFSCVGIPLLTSVNAKRGPSAVYWEFFDCRVNPSLLCIQVDDAAFMTANFSGYKDAIASFSENCTPCTNVTYSYTKTDAGCYGSATGVITVTPTNGVAPYSYRISNSANYVPSSTFSNLKKGNYRVYIQDANGCAGFTPYIFIDQSPAVTGNASTTDVSPCSTSNNGSMTVTGAVGASPYQYKLGSNGTYTTTNIFNNLKGVTYAVYIQDAAGCIGRINVPIPHPDPVTVDFTKTDITCASPTGTITLSAPGSPNATFKINPGSSVYTSQNVFAGLAAGTYYGYAKNTVGCTGRVGPVVLAPATGCRNSFAEGKMKATGEPNGNELTVSLSPNPSSNVFRLTTRTAKTEAIQLRVIDINGKVVYTAKGSPAQSFTFGEALPNGVYMIEVRQGIDVTTTKVIKN